VMETARDAGIEEEKVQEIKLELDRDAAGSCGLLPDTDTCIS